MLVANVSAKKRAKLIDENKRRNLHSVSPEENMEAPKRRQVMFASLIVLGIAIAAIISIWYLHQLSLAKSSSGEGGQITIFTISNLSLSDPPGDEHPGTFAPDFFLADANETSSWLSDFQGKVVVLDLMATWCGPCRLEMPHLRVIWEKYEEKIVIMSIDIDPTESAETLRSFAQEFTYATWIWAIDTVNLGEAYKVWAIPKTVIIDQDGYIRFTHTGVTDAPTFIQEIDQLLGEDNW